MYTLPRKEPLLSSDWPLQVHDEWTGDGDGSLQPAFLPQPSEPLALDIGECLGSVVAGQRCIVEMDHKVIRRFCAPACIKPRRKPITPSPATASPDPVSHAESVTSQVSFKFSPPTSSAVIIPSSSVGGTCP